MAEFERGDIVVYVHPDAPADGHGALAIVDVVREHDMDVQWVTTSNFLAEYFADHYNSANLNWEPRSFEKVGHLDGF